MTDECTEQRFLKDIERHNMTVNLDDGVHRHLTFKREGSRCYRFDLVTWPGHLTVTGDCGTYTFERVPDMFDFFRPGPDYKLRHPEGPLFVNPGYWGQKLNSICKLGGYREYSETAFTQRVKSHFNDYCEYGDDMDTGALWQAIKQNVLSRAYIETDAYAAVSDFEYGDFDFVDFFDSSGGTDEYTFHYIWCLYAIVSGIETYDTHKLATN